MALLETYARVARALFRVRAVLFAGVLAGLGFFLAGVLHADADYAESRTLLPVLALAWCLCTLVFAYALRGEMPAVEPRAGPWRRLVTRTRRLGLYTVALLTTVLGAGTLLLTLRALLIVRHEVGA